MSRAAIPTFAIALAACAQVAFTLCAFAGPNDTLIAKHAAANGVPETLVRRIIRIESRGNPRVVSKGNYGLMQIRLGTARAMGYSGTADGLLDPDINMTYAVKYLAGAYRAAKCDEVRAVAYYQRGFYGAAQTTCGAPRSLPAQIAKAETGASGRPRSDDPAGPAADVIKPRVVSIETISKSKSAPALKAVKFEPVRVSTPPAPAVELEAVSDQTVAVAQADQTKPQVVAKLDPEIVPLPPVRPVLDPPPPSRKVKSARHVRHRHAHSGRAARADEQVGLLAALKKLVTPDKRSRRRASHAQLQTR